MTVEYTLLALAVPALLAAAGFAVWTRLRTRRMLDTCLLYTSRCV